MKNNQVNMYDLIFCLTNTGDLISNTISSHHKKVAYLAFRIAKQFGLTASQQNEVFLAGLLHDIGAFSKRDRLELIETEAPDANNHAVIGAKILEGFAPLHEAAKIIRYHHTPWKGHESKTFDGGSVPLASHIIHLADRIAVQICPGKGAIGQIKGICEKIMRGSGTIFMPELVEAFLSLSGKEYIWLDLNYEPLMTIMPSMMNFDTVELGLDEVIKLSEVFAYIIDFRSHFTANHSSGVAAVAAKIADLVGFSENEQKMMLVAGYLHDLGKLAIDSEILEKPSKLEIEEYNEIKSHTFYTFRTLQVIPGFETINVWASYHHERLDGKGYPFHLTSEDIPLGSRIMAVADVFTAISEDRPYRKGMNQFAVVKVIRNMVETNALCPFVAEVLIDNYELLNECRIKEQIKAALKYKALENTQISLQKV